MDLKDFLKLIKESRERKEVLAAGSIVNHHSLESQIGNTIIMDNNRITHFGDYNNIILLTWMADKETPIQYGMMHAYVTLKGKETQLKKRIREIVQDIQPIGSIRSYHPFNKEVFRNTKKFPGKHYDYIILQFYSEGSYISSGKFNPNKITDREIMEKFIQDQTQP